MRILIILLLMLSGSLAHGLCVKVKEANLRTGPGGKFKVSWVVGKYMPFEELGRKKSWIRVKDLDGKVHWIARSLVSDSLSCIVVKTKTQVLRTGPGDNFEKAPIRVVDKYAPFLNQGGEDGWIMVKDRHGFSGWLPLRGTWTSSAETQNLTF